MTVTLPTGRAYSANIICPGCTLTIAESPFVYDFIMFDMCAYDLILGLDWLTYFKAHIIFDQRRIELTKPSGKRVKYTNEQLNLTPYSRRYYSSLSCLLANLTVKEELSETNYPRVVSEFRDVFLEDISGLPPVREIDF